MKILLINVVYAKGSTGSIIHSLYSEYRRKGHDAYVIYGRGQNIHNDSNVKKCTIEIESKVHHFFSTFFGNMYGGMFFSTLKIISFIKKVKPDYVNLHCLNGYFVNIYRLLKFLARNNYKVLLSMHAEFMMTGGCGYTIECNKYLSDSCKKCPRFNEINSPMSINSAHNNYIKMSRAINLFDDKKLKVSCVSPWLSKRYKESPIYKKYDIYTILNPVDDIFINDFSGHFYNKKYILYVTSDFYDKEKNGTGIIKLATAMSDTNFIVVSTKKIFNPPMLHNVEFISGGISKEALRDYYFNADCLVLLSKRETFSMPVAEALSCGIPVAGFKNGGSESFSSSFNTIWCKFDDYHSLEEAIRHFMKQCKKEKNLSFSKDKICDNYLKLLKGF